MGQLITLPLRLTACTASFVLRGSEEVVKRALSLTGRAVEAEPRYAGRPPVARDAAPPRPRPVAPRKPTPAPPPPAQAPASPPTPAQAPAPPPTPAQAPPPPLALVDEPTHVSREPTLVEELAEAGAEDGAGAQVRIDEPWEGYSRLGAKAVIARLRDADSAELAAVNLYESAHRARRTVLSAVERQLAARGSAPN